MVVEINDLEIPDGVRYRAIAAIDQAVNEMTSLREGNDKAEEMLAAANILPTGPAARNDTANQVKASLMARLENEFYISEADRDIISDRIDEAVQADIKVRRSR